MEHWLYSKDGFSKYDTAESTLFVWQRMRTQGHTIPALHYHLERLSAVSREIFGSAITLQAKEVEQRCRELLLRGNYSDKGIHIVEIRLEASADYSLRVVESSIYKKLDLRVVRPKAHLVELAGQALTLPTSTAQSVQQLLATIATANDCAIAVATDAKGRVWSVDGASPIVVKGLKITLSPTIESAEMLQAEKILRERYADHLTIGPITTEQIAAADELFYVDARGITSVSQCGESSYSDSIAYALSKFTK